MGKITTHTVTAAKAAPRITRADRELADYQRKERARINTERTSRFRGNDVTRCSACGPIRFCADCERINKARVYAGLLVPREDPAPHKWNTLIPVCYGPMSGGCNKNYHAKRYPVITACARRRGGGWWQGVASLDGRDVYVGKSTRDRDAAFAYATRSAADVREGVRYAASVGA